MGKSLSAELKALALGFADAIGTPLASSLSRDIREGKWDSIATRKVDPRAYTDAQEYFLDASVASLLRKCKDLPSSFDRKGAALANWRQGEVDCYRTNERLSPYLEGMSHPDCNEDVMRHIGAIREKIASVLGRAPRMEELNPKHGPGATYSDISTRSTLADKMDSQASITPNALWFLLDWVGTAWGRNCLQRDRSPVFVRGNRFTTAPKDSTKDRPIAAEPSVNIFYQLALGDAIRRRLKLVGIDITSGKETHMRLACEASKTGHLATLDLKNASDTVAYNLVKLFLPAPWFALLRELRAPFTEFGPDDLGTLTGRPQESGSWVRLEKFSSMGNGFTFELETLIFWAIADYSSEQAVGPGREKTLTFGDDIICDQRSVNAVIAALRFFGFTINEEKSFWSGPFRESCGGDYWDGRFVRPYFQEDSLDEPHKLIAAANQIRRLGFDLFGGLGPFAPVWHALQDQLPLRVRRCRGPTRLGDVVLHDEEVNWSWTSRQQDKFFAWVPVKHRKVSLRNFGEGTVLACGLYGVRVSEGFINPRDSVTGYDVRRVPAYGIRWVPTQRLVRGPSTLPTPSGFTGPDYAICYRVVGRSD